MKRHPLASLPMLAALVMTSLSLASTPALAQDDRDRQASDQARAELDAARRELHEASRRVAELSRQLAEQAASEAGEQVIALRELRMSKPIIGIVMAESDEGVAIAGTTPDSPAARAGIKPGDILIAVGGKKITGRDAEARLGKARELIGELEEGERVELTYQRDGRSHDVALQAEKMDRLMVWTPQAGALAPLARLGEHFDIDIVRGIDDDAMTQRIERIVIDDADCQGPETDCAEHRVFQAMRWAGLNLTSLDSDLGRYFGIERGALVLNPGRHLDGLKAGDVILAVNGEATDDPRAVLRGLRKLSPGEQANLSIQRDRHAETITVTVPEATAMRFIKAPRAPAPPPPPPPPAPPRPNQPI
ncbi:MAG TPA: hypothetical protein DDZ76_08020 [Xanthomonadales bacterium]|nr:hypothetical protein [Xanthomonadales bacterium]